MIFLATVENPIEHVIDGPVTIFGEDTGRFLASLGITKHVFFLFVAGALVTVIFILRARRVKRGEKTPGLWGGFLESIMLFLRDEVMRPILGRAGDRYLPFIWTLFFFILACNLLGLVPGAATATGNISINAGLAAVAFVTWHLLGIKEQGLWHYLKTLIPPVPLFVWPIMLVVEFVGHLIRPFALTVRLFANMLAGHVILATILGFTRLLTTDRLVLGSFVSLASVAGATALTMLEIFVAFLQAFIFTFLTALFIGMAVKPEH